MGGHLFVFGLGYSAGVLARRLVAEGWTVTGTRRSVDDTAGQPGITLLPWDGAAADPAIADALHRATHLLNSVPPSADGDPVIAQFGDEIPGCANLSWIGYLSTVGVYGDTGGQPVDESSPTNPSGARGQKRVLAENQWLALGRQSGLPVHVFRLPGIYGPGRSVLDRIQAGKGALVDKPGHCFSRIHVADIAGVLRASMDRPDPGAIYNVCDAEPAEPAAVTRFGYQLLGIDPPPAMPFAEAAKAMSPMALSFWRDNRRVVAEKIQRDLGYTLKYPSYREGLRAIAADRDQV